MEQEKTQKDRQATQCALIEAATTLFAEKGYEGATTKDIAALARRNESLIQRYFEGKDGLLLAVLRAGQKKQAVTCIEALPDQACLAEEILQIAQTLRESMLQRSPEIKIALSRLLVDANFQRKFLDISFAHEYHGVIRERLQRYQDAGKINPHQDLAVIVAMLSGIFMHIGFIKPEVLRLSEAEVAQETRAFCEIFARGLV